MNCPHCGKPINAAAMLGSISTPAKAKAARENAKLGGIEISEANYKALCEVAKALPTELAAKGTKSKNGNERIVVECRQGPLMSGDAACGGNYMLAIVQAANLMREISYNAQIVRLQEERDGYAD